MRSPFDPRLCLVIGPDDTLGRDPVEVAERALRGGVSMLQLRWKHADDASLLALARCLAIVTRRFGVPLILNDRVDLVAAAGAQGAHVGQSDLAAGRARALLGPNALLGLSIETESQIKVLDEALVDYVGVGPIFATVTKPDHAVPLGVGGLAAMRGALTVPILAIGGVGVDSAAALRRAGANGLAVVSAICGAADPEAAAAQLVTAFTG
ncbi:MAG: thiamine phosphate synthase [Polyangiales bacterium]